MRISLCICIISVVFMFVLIVFDFIYSKRFSVDLKKSLFILEFINVSYGALLCLFFIFVLIYFDLISINLI